MDNMGLHAIKSQKITIISNSTFYDKIMFFLDGVAVVPDCSGINCQVTLTNITAESSHIVMIAFDIKRGTENSLLNEKLVLEYYHNTDLDLYANGGAVRVEVPFNLVSTGNEPPSILNPVNGAPVVPDEKKESRRNVLFIALGVFAAVFLVISSIIICCLTRGCCCRKSAMHIPVGLLNEDQEV